MQMFLCCLLMASSALAAARSLRETPQQSLNQYVAFMNQSVDEMTGRFQRLQAYYADTRLYQQKTDFLLRLPSSGPLEEYYYRKALASDGLKAAEKQRLSASAQSLWELLNKLDQTAKALETYVRLKDYQRDRLKQSDELIREIQALFSQFSRNQEAFYEQIQQVYRRYQPYLPSDSYLYAEKEMEQVLLSQKQLLNTLPFYLNEDSRADWPVESVKQSILADEKLLSDFGKVRSAIAYPASDMINLFRTALQSTQSVKRRAVDDYTFAARQSARHGNAVYRSLLAQYNQDLLASHQAFVKYSVAAKHLLDYPKFCPVFTLEPAASAPQPTSRTVPFQDAPLVKLSIKPAASPAAEATFLSLNAYVEFINESLRQMHYLQVLLRNYQSSADAYRDPVRARQRANLSYSHEEYKVPISDYQLLVSSSRYIPQLYRASINSQAEVLMNMLKEMDGLSVELIEYTKDKQYLQDRLQRSDEVLDRYAYLFDTFDQKKEQLYRDVRRIHESYPVKDPSRSWHIAGKALLKTLDDSKDALFGVKAYLRAEAVQLPDTDKLVANARTLIKDEYTNLKGLQRFGRNNGLCPYSPYEDIAENALRFAEKCQQLKPGASGANPYETFYYFFNNELVYEYNKFSELAKVGVLKTVNQPDLLIFQRQSRLEPVQASPAVVQSVSQEVPTDTKPVQESLSVVRPLVGTSTAVTQGTSVQHDTVYVERTKVDTVYVDRGPQAAPNSLKGFAANNMVLLLDVSASMDSPYKLPLLKKSIKSLLKLLRPEDQVSIVVYSGKARVALKPTSGANGDEIARVIDQLQSDGDTDGDDGIRLAYKIANKHYIRAGNNRIILATDGEFSISDDVYRLVSENTRQDVYLTVFTFGRNDINGRNLKRVASSGKGNYVHITPENANIGLILEAQAKKTP